MFIHKFNKVWFSVLLLSHTVKLNTCIITLVQSSSCPPSLSQLASGLKRLSSMQPTSSPSPPHLSHSDLHPTFIFLFTTTSVQTLGGPLLNPLTNGISFRVLSQNKFIHFSFSINIFKSSKRSLLIELAEDLICVSRKICITHRD